VPLAAATRSRTMSAQEAADHVGVTERTVRRWISSGTLRAEKIGRSFAIHLDDLEALGGIARGRAQSAKLVEREREAAFHELQGAYNQLRELYDLAQQELAAERRRNARLEVQLEQAA
jgi:excisionase family DNA binding protein